jgi:DNA-binding NarL/FixJ family response regulator
MRTLVADDHEVVRQGLRALIEAHPGWEVCAECADGREAVERSAELRPDVAVLDITMPELDGLEAARQIRRARPATAVVIFSVHDSERMVRDVLRAGAFGYVAKTAPPQDLISAIDAAHRRRPLFLAQSFDCVLHRLAEEPGFWRDEFEPSVLNGKEREIVQLLASGRSNKEVSTRLGIGLKTVEAHRARIMRKIHASSAAGLVRYAIRNGLVEA